MASVECGFEAFDRLEEKQHAGARIAVRMNARKHPHVAYATIAQQLEKRARHVGGAIGGKQRTAKAFGLSRIERARERQPQLASAGCSRAAMGADHANGLSHGRAKPSDRVAREELRADLALCDP